MPRYETCWLIYIRRSDFHTEDISSSTKVFIYFLFTACLHLCEGAAESKYWIRIEEIVVTSRIPVFELHFLVLILWNDCCEECRSVCFAHLPLYYDLWLQRGPGCDPAGSFLWRVCMSSEGTSFRTQLSQSLGSTSVETPIFLRIYEKTSNSKTTISISNSWLRSIVFFHV